MSKDTKEEIEQKYNHEELPKVKNWFLYTYRSFMKLFFIAFFGIGSVVLAVLVFPWIRIFVHPKQKFQEKARAFVSASFRMFINLMRFAGVIKLVVDDKNAYRNLHSKVLVANHPSLLDFVFIMSMVPNANCIVRGGLANGILGGVIRQCYIVNSLDFDELCKLCKETLDDGCNVIIFPEGTRSPRHGVNAYKKGAARIAYYSKCDVQPILVGGNDKYGLGKHDPTWSFNHTEPMIYSFSLLPQIKISDYIELPEAIAAKRLTEKMQEVIYAAVDENDKHYVTNRVKK